ncbi:MAG: methylmalonyl-CoA mutase [Geminicoccaceae bacterium]|nr:methylmalonyl-CoA mutase [Geminicoccaceae bacterium]
MNDRVTPLASDFDPVTHDQWMVLVEKVLAGRDFERTLVSRTADGIAVSPLFTEADRPASGSGTSGAYPFVRGSVASGDVAAWDIRQLVFASRPADARKEVDEELAGGATSVELRIDRENRLSGDVPDGIVLGTTGDLAEVLGGADGNSLELAFDPGPGFVAVAGMATELELRRVALNADPLGAVALGDMTPGGAVDSAVGLASAVPASWGLLRACGEVYHAAGASDAEELAAVVATGIAYLRALADSGMPVDDAGRRISLRLAVDTDIFGSMAKLRAARRLWARVLDASGVSQPRTGIEAITASRMLTRRDSWTNLLRTTTATFAGLCGGARAMTVLPHDWSLGTSNGRSRRLARNVQLILMEESQLHRVIDPAGGAYLVESLTDGLARLAWERVQGIEAAGGMEAALSAGIIQEAIAATAAARLERIATNREPVIGVSSFPRLDEPAATAEAHGYVPPSDPALAGFEPIAHPLEPSRLGGDFERLRDISDDLLARDGQRPRIWLACIGSLAEHGARANFARNAFEAGGIEAVASGPLDDVSMLASAFAGSNCRMACLCGSDAGYEQRAAAFAAALVDAGAEAVYLAGRPDAKLREAGIDKFVYAGCDLLSLLEDAQSLLIGGRP